MFFTISKVIKQCGLLTDSSEDVHYELIWWQLRLQMPCVIDTEPVTAQQPWVPSVCLNLIYRQHVTNYNIEYKLTELSFFLFVCNTFFLDRIITIHKIWFTTIHTNALLPADFKRIMSIWISRLIISCIPDSHFNYI